MSSKEALELEKLRAEISNVSVNTRKVFAEIRKLERETTLYPIVVGSGLTLALVGLLKAFS